MEVLTIIRCWICGTDLRDDGLPCIICGNMRPGRPPTDEEMTEIKAELARRKEALRQS